MKIIAVTACPNGVAHTYMSAVKLEENAKKMGYQIHVEKQGAAGVEDRLTAEQIKEADIVILASEILIKEEERFDGKKIFRCAVTLPIKINEEVFKVAELEGKIESLKCDEANNIETEEIHRPSYYLINALSNIIPFVIAATLMISISAMISSFVGITNIEAIDPYASSVPLSLLYGFHHIGLKLLEFLIPLFSALIAFSMAGRNGLAAGLVGGIIVWGAQCGPIPAVIVGYFAGYTTIKMMKKFKVSGPANAFTSMFVVPMLSPGLTGLFAMVVLAVPFYFMNKFFMAFLDTPYSFILYMLLAVIAVWDLGGRYNKIAMLIGITLFVNGNFTANTIVQVAIIVPTFGYGLLSFASKKNFPSAYNNIGKHALKMGVVGVAEGAIPFTKEHPHMFRIFNIVGVIISTIIILITGTINPIPMAGIYGIFFIQKPLSYVFAVVIGVLFVAIASFIYVRFFDYKMPEKTI